MISFVTLEIEEWDGVGGESQEGAGHKKRGGVKRGGEKGRGAAMEGGMIVRGAETAAERARGREEAAKEQLSS